MRRQSVRQSNACEYATSKKCRCRCGGQLHGAARVDRVEKLPRNDPHAVSEKWRAKFAQMDLFSESKAQEA